jgi:hypothetical protein
VARGELTDDEWAFIAPFLPMGRNGPYPERLVAVRRRAALPVDCQRADFGALKVPSLPGAESHPLRAGDRVVVVFGGHALGLQAYRTHDAPVWDSVRPKVIEQIGPRVGARRTARAVSARRFWPRSLWCETDSGCPSRLGSSDATGRAGCCAACWPGRRRCPRPSIREL